MSIESRTPEGTPSQCPLCGGADNIEFSDPPGDAVCPRCGHRLRVSAQVVDLLVSKFSDTIEVTSGKLRADSRFTDLGADSLDSVELVMGLEDEFEVSIPDDVAAKLDTVGDVVSFLESARN